MTNGQKLKPLYLMDYLLRYADEDAPVTMKQILDHLRSQGIPAERKGIYGDLEALRAYGLDILTAGSGKNTAYFVGQRTFELPELKLLVDSVQSAKFITRAKTDALIRKIETLTSVHEARNLQRQVYVANRVKQMNESIYYNVDKIHSAISRNRQLRFRYFRYTVRKTKEYRRGGAEYRVSPYALTWDDENYYLVAYDPENREIRHYRVDKMDRIRVAGEEREGLEAFRALDMGKYSRAVFGMFSGEPTQVTLRFRNHLVGAVLDRLGQDAPLVQEDEDHFRVTAEVVVSPQFFAWVFGFGTEARILSPASAAEEMGRYAAAVSDLYRGQNAEVSC
jgi:predicted DNA-binding transcriptional regulator YafY